MSRKKLPYFCWYPADFEVDENVKLMNIEEIGLYAVCLNHCWINGSLPADPAEICRAMKVPKPQFARAWPRVKPCFIQREDGRWVNARQERERELAHVKSDQARKAANKRHGKDAFTSASAVRPHDPRMHSAMPRASDSGSDSGSGVPGKGAGKPQTLALAGQSIQEILEELKQIYSRAGCPIPPKHEQLAAQFLVDIPAEKRHRVPDYVKHCLLTGRWRGASTTKSLLNLLRDGDWDVEITKRTLPSPKPENASDIAERVEILKRRSAARAGAR